MVVILLLAEVCHQALGQNETFTKQLVFLCNYLAFGAWA